MIKIEELEKKLNQGNMDCIYLLYGEELFLLENSLKKIRKLFGECIKGINYIQIDDTNLTGIISDIETPAFGYEKKLIVVRNSGILKKEGKRKNAEMAKLKENLAEYIEKNHEIIKENVIIVIIEEVIDNKNNLYKVLDKYGTVCNFETQKPIQLEKRLKAIFKGYEVNITDAEIKYLIESAGTNMQELINESRKLIEYAGTNGIVKKEDIDILCIKKLESVIFDLTDSLGKKETRKGITSVKKLNICERTITENINYII